jgi:putative ABC transport system permease protein
VQGLLLAALIGGAVVFSGNAVLALGTLGGVALVLVVLAGAGWGLARGARRLSRAGLVRGRPGLRLALAAIGGPRSEVLAVVLSLGLGLSVLAIVGQIDANFRLAIQRDLPERAPSFFFVDLQPDQLEPFLARMAADPAVSRVESAAMLRGAVLAINGVKPTGDHWVLRGDRGISLADAMPEGTELTAGRWWGADGAPEVSFAAKEAAELGLKLGDRLTLSILGREIDLTLTSLREVDFTTAGMGFVMIVNKAALAGAPYTAIATVYAAPEAEAAILRDAARTWPNVTAISVKEAIARVVEALTAIATATVAAAGAVLVVGGVVLIGAVLAGVPGRVREASVLKVLGATRGAILGSFALRAGLMGAAAGLVAVASGALGGWAVMRLVMDLPFVFEPISALAIVAGGVVVTLVAGLIFAAVPISARPAGVLRSSEG